ncbi:SRPBCC domain-containing protein [Flavobacterium jejuense]|uniref:SRPBCC domain-containing protein n=1 Tax=Flavobacterium jejuense TaxID=1544455 RepID=A0ABX0IN84_9FLAO|nr:SRPBCC domain-containing protein [Flavobacterium jejuense]NHN25259.1 SRPBCC domain-containing protein [Flavobacterium jejuense]
MSKLIRTEILINVSPKKVWTILQKFEDYPNWNPFINLIKGDFKVGNQIKVTITPPGSKPMTFKPKVLTYKFNKELSWLGSLLFTGIFDGAHKFELIDNGNGTTTFIQSENFKGILVPLFKNSLEKNTKNGFELMNLKLKELAESK